MLVAVPGSEEYVRATTVELPFCSGQMREVIAARRADPQDDIISFLVQQEVDDRPVTDDEVFSMVDLLLAGGVGTTASLVSQTLVWLYQHPDVRQTLIDDPDLLDRAIEEFLRYFSPTQALARTVTKDAEFHGCPVKVGDRVLLAWASANRARSSSTPRELDIERWPNRHTAFGVGVHRCAGSHLGRAMAKELLGQILERMPDYVVDLDALEPYPHQGTNTGWRYLRRRSRPARAAESAWTSAHDGPGHAPGRGDHHVLRRGPGDHRLAVPHVRALAAGHRRGPLARRPGDADHPAPRRQGGDGRAYPISNNAYRYGALAEGIICRLPLANHAVFFKILDFESLFMSRKDGEEHARLRRIASRAFTARRIESCATRSRGTSTT